MNSCIVFRRPDVPYQFHSTIWTLFDINSHKGLNGRKGFDRQGRLLLIIMLDWTNKGLKMWKLKPFWILRIIWCQIKINGWVLLFAEQKILLHNKRMLSIRKATAMIWIINILFQEFYPNESKQTLQSVDCLQDFQHEILSIKYVFWSKFALNTDQFYFCDLFLNLFSG